MQIFMPLVSFQESVAVLDSKRLGNQRREVVAVQTMIASVRAAGVSSPFVNQPLVAMWYGYEKALQLYLSLCIEEWVRRGFKNNMLYDHPQSLELAQFPQWRTNEVFHLSHREALVRKAYEDEDNGHPIAKDYDYRLRWPYISRERAEASKYNWPVGEPWWQEFGKSRSPKTRKK